MTATAWAIKDWDRAFETWQTRRIKKGLEYIKVPAGRQCRAYKLLMAEPDGALIYGVFVALCQFAASRQCRGLLADPDRELSVAELGVEVLCNPTAVSRAIEVLASPAIGWLVRTDIPTDGRHIWDRDPHTTDDDREAHQSASDDRRAHQSASDLAHITKQNKTEQNSTRSWVDVDPSAQAHLPRRDASASLVESAAKPEFSSRVEAIYNACTWKRDKPRTAKKAIQAAGRRVTARYLGDSDKAMAYLLERVKAYAGSVLVATTPKQYLPGPAPWFNGDKFDEPDEEWAQARNAGTDSDGPTLEVA